MDRDAAQRLLAWFESTRRDLPWRGPFPRDPWAVLVSEVMLQQTQVNRVIEGYRTFMLRFPTLTSLATAREDEAVEAFSGMGYYGRARRLHRAAKELAALGSWPTAASELSLLPGLGRYTSAAIAAFAFAGADPPVDGNVARVAARVLARPLRLGSLALAREAEALARELHASAPTPEIYEALIELGASLCAPRAPRCADCPLRLDCAAAGRAEGFPAPRPRREPEHQTWVALWLEREDGAVLLRRVEDGEPLAGLWLPPIAAVSRSGDARNAAGDLATSLGHGGALDAREAVLHSITHRRITVRPFVGSWRPRGVSETDAQVCFRRPTAPGLPTSSLLVKLRAACTGPRHGTAAGTGAEGY